MTNVLHQRDLPADVDLGSVVAVDTETLGLNPYRDRLCLVQLSAGDGDAHLVQIAAGQTEAPRLTAMLTDPAVLKVFHFARFDLAALSHAFAITVEPVYCTKIASRLTRTYTDRHSLKDLCRELLDVDISKQQQSSDWGAETLSEAQTGLCRLRRVAPACSQNRTRPVVVPRGASAPCEGLFRLFAEPRGP